MKEEEEEEEEEEANVMETGFSSSWESVGYEITGIIIHCSHYLSFHWLRAYS